MIDSGEYFTAYKMLMKKMKTIKKKSIEHLYVYKTYVQILNTVLTNLAFSDNNSSTPHKLPPSAPEIELVRINEYKTEFLDSRVYSICFYFLKMAETQAPTGSEW